MLLGVLSGRTAIWCEKQTKKQRSSVHAAAINARWRAEVCVTLGAARPQREHPFLREPMKIIPIHVGGKGKKCEGRLEKSAG